ncbi:hypothetical protein ENBRE01_3183, partial [Enteropsectra breve]
MRSVVSSSLWFIYLRGQTGYLLNVFSYCYALDKIYGSCPLVDLWITILVKAGKMDILRNIITVADKRKNGSLLKYIFLNYKCDPSFFFSDNISLAGRTILSREFKANMWKIHLMTNTHCFFYLEVMHFLDDYEHSDAAICRIKDLPGWFPRVPKEKIAAMFDMIFGGRKIQNTGYLVLALENTAIPTNLPQADVEEWCEATKIEYSLYKLYYFREVCSTNKFFATYFEYILSYLDKKLHDDRLLELKLCTAWYLIKIALLYANDEQLREMLSATINTSRPHYFASILLLCLEDNVKCKLLDWFALRVTSRKRKIEQ